ncbi:AMP-binding protein [Aquibium sp. LZ166]|uniref:AMP-binding protein n=1 Tax=Aquibium pacificus TaxID=3153579 RepID=A0ABV3SMR4_9HYPH
MTRRLKTTRPVLEVRTIEDVAAIESRPYDELVTAHNLYDLFLATAQHVGGQKALTVLRSPDPADVGAALTHAELLGEVTRAANLFRGMGLAPGRGVAAFLAPTLPELPALLLGAQVAGVASSLNYLLSREAIVDLLNAEKATLLVVSAQQRDATCWDKAQGMLDAVPTLTQVIVIGGGANLPAGHVALDAALAGHRADRLDFEPTDDRDTVCALFHTGGTTGRPKLVQLTHGNQIHAAFGFAQVYGYDENDVVINGFPFFHVGGTMTVGMSVLAAGGHVVVPSPYALRPAAVVESYWGLVEAFGATVVSGVPTSIAALTNSFRQGTNVSTVCMAVTGGAVLPEAVGSRFEATTGIRLFETYGMTETAAAIAFNPGRGEPVAGSVGFRAPFSRTRIVRLGKEDETCGPGESGLVQVKGPQVFPGYVDPAHNVGTLGADGWLTTGDVGYMTAQERLVLTGREKDLIVRGGHNIDPAAIEDVANRFTGVQISAAVGMPDQYAGEVPALFVVPAPGAAIDVEALKDHLEKTVHEPPARPKSVLVIDALPVTAVGKIFKPALRDMAIKEKVRLEVERICGVDAAAFVEVSMDAQKRTLVEIELSDATSEQIAALEAALKPLPQSYLLRDAAEEPVRLHYENGIATLTLGRPKNLNAASEAMMQSMERRLRRVAGLPGLRAVILTGSGRAFCAGGDLIEFEAALRAGGTKLVDVLRYNQDVIQMIEDLPVPVIGAANGTAVAGGLELLLACDIVIAADDARMGDGHARFGIVPAGGATVRLEEKIGRARAAQLFYTASLIDAPTAARWGLVAEIVAGDRLMERAQEIAREICRASPEVLRHVKQLTGQPKRSDERRRRLRAEIEHFARHVEGRDLAEGLTAFKAKREPEYGDR